MCIRDRVAARVDAKVAADRACIAKGRRRNEAGGFGVPRVSSAQVRVRRCRRQRHAGINHRLALSAMHGARQEVEADERLDIKLPSLLLRKQVRAPGDEHRPRAEVRCHARGFSRGLGSQVLKSRQAQHDPVPSVVVQPSWLADRGCQESLVVRSEGAPLCPCGATLRQSSPA